jgi:hypothetical protein
LNSKAGIFGEEFWKKIVACHLLSVERWNPQDAL